MGPRASLDGRNISFPPGFDPGPSSPYSVAIPAELPGALNLLVLSLMYISKSLVHTSVSSPRITMGGGGHLHPFLDGKAYRQMRS